MLSPRELKQERKRAAAFKSMLDNTLVEVRHKRKDPEWLKKMEARVDRTMSAVKGNSRVNLPLGR